MPDLFIGGEWTGAESGEQRGLRCPADGRVFTSVDEGARVDTERAIAAAREAFDNGPWRGLPARERGDLLVRVAAILQRDKAAIARAESLDTGKRLVESEYDVDDVTNVFRYYGGVADSSPGHVVDAGNPGVVSRIVYEPVGVCGLITPWNYPLLQTSWKVAPALAAGNTFVLKPSELSPSTAILLMKVVGQLTGEVVAADEQEMLRAGGAHPGPGVAALALGAGNGHGLPVPVGGQVGGGEGVGAEPGDRVELDGERAAHAQHVADLVVLQMLAQLAGAAVDLVAGAPRGIV